MNLESEEGLLSKTSPEQRFVGFLDVLGFSRIVTADFAGAVNLYDEFLASINRCRGIEELEVSTRILSDSILLVSPRLRDVVVASNVMQFAALFSNCLLRGGIATGKHVERAKDGDLFVVSEALVHAAELERTVKHPCVAVHTNAEPFIFPARTFTNSNFERLLLYYDNRWIVNPFGVMWGTSAATRVELLKDAHPEFADKYDWFLGLYEAVRTGRRLLPDVER